MEWRQIGHSRLYLWGCNSSFHFYIARLLASQKLLRDCEAIAKKEHISMLLRDLHYCNSRSESLLIRAPDSSDLVVSQQSFANSQ